MKKLLALILALMMCTLVLVACDEDDLSAVAPEEPSTSDTQPNNNTNSNTNPNTNPTEPTEVGSLSGKTPKQLMALMGATMTTATSIEVSGVSTETYGEYKYISTLELKMSGDAMAISVKMQEFGPDITVGENENTATITIVENTAYMDQDGKKIKYPNMGIEDVFGENWYEEVFEFDNEYPDSVFEGVKLYKAGEEYYFTLSLTKENYPDFDFYYEEPATLTVYFDKNGEPTKIEEKSGTDSTTMAFSNINKPVSVKAPDDAASYTEYDPVDPAGYAKYQEICAKLAGAESYIMNYTQYDYVDENFEVSPSIEFVYSRDKEGDNRVDMESEGTYIEIYKVGGIYYVSADGQVQVLDNPEESIVQIFVQGDSLTGLLSTVAPSTQIKALSIEEYEILGEKVYTIYIEDNSGNEMEYSFNESMTEIDVSLYKYENGEWVQSLHLGYYSINTGEVNIQAPNLGYYSINTGEVNIQAPTTSSEGNIQNSGANTESGWGELITP